MWFPLLAEQFVAGLGSGQEENQGICNVIVEAYRNSTDTVSCKW